MKRTELSKRTCPEQSRRKPGGQPGNQNARIHGRYSTVISPREAEVLKAVASLDDHGQRVIFTSLLEHLIPPESRHLLEPDSFCPVPEKVERMPLDLNTDADLSAWIKERNIDLDCLMRDALKTIQG
jgi:hypothetical protein